MRGRTFPGIAAALVASPLAAAILAVGASLFIGGPIGHVPAADGHALLASSDPSAGATLATAPGSVTIVFTEAADPKLSSIQVLDVAGTGHTIGPAGPSSAGPTALTVPVGSLVSGVYTVAWRSVSSVDGHAAAGSFAFTVGQASAPSSVEGGGGSGGGPGGGSGGGGSGGGPVGPVGPVGPGSLAAGPPVGAGASAVSPASIAVRAVMYLGLIGLLGALFVAEIAARRRGRRLLAFAFACWVIALVGAVGILVAEAADANVSLGDALRSSLGRAALARVAPILLAGLPIVVARRPSARQGAAIGLAAILVLLAFLSDALVSHAATTAVAPANVAVQWLHGVGVAVWLGGLAGLLFELGDPGAVERGALVGRFSRWATAGLVLVATTGVFRAAFELHDVAELVTTDYGRLLVAKTVLLGVIAILGALNHFRHVPAGDAGVSSVRRAGSGEVVVGVVVVVIASILVMTPPPADMTAAQVPSSPGIVVDGSDYATTVRLRLSVTPGTAGPNQFRATATDYDTGAAVPASAISLRFSFPARPDVGASNLALAAAGSGTFAGSGANLSLAGTWSVTALVAEPGTSVEVPLTVAVAEPGAASGAGASPGSGAGGPVPASPQVDVNRAPGQPTIYTIHLGAGDTAQLYLDEWAATAADLHVTYFDPAGKELPVTDISATVTQAGGLAAPVTMKALEPGHAVGHLRTTAGVPMSIVVTGRAPDGGILTSSVTMTPGR